WPGIPRFFRLLGLYGRTCRAPGRRCCAVVIGLSNPTNGSEAVAPKVRNGRSEALSIVARQSRITRGLDPFSRRMQKARRHEHPPIAPIGELQDADTFSIERRYRRVTDSGEVGKVLREFRVC